MPTISRHPPHEQPAARVRDIHRRLQRRYRAADLGNVADPLDEAIYIVLSRQTQEAMYQELYTRLRRRCGGDWSAVLEMDTSELEALLRPGGFHRQRAAQLRSLIAAVRARCDQLGTERLTLDWLADLDDARCECELVALPGIGPKTARCVMGYALGRNVLAVDTHVARVMARLGLIEPVTGKPNHAYIEAIVPERIRVRFHVNLIHHGRAVCTARAPRCDRCCIAHLCPREGSGYPS